MLKLPPDEVVRIRKMVPTIRELRIIDLMRDYRAIRKRYFGKSIPEVESVAISLVLGSVLENIYDEGCLGLNINHDAYVILIAEQSSVNETRMTLLHEMAHIKVEIKWNRSMGHGKYWQAEMKRLARRGAFEAWW